MGETPTAVAAPPAESAPPVPGGIVLDSVEWDSSHLNPEPAFMTEASIPAAPEAPAAEAVPVPESAEARPLNITPEFQEPTAQPAEAEQEPAKRPIVKDPEGVEWQDLGPTEAGSHKILSLDGFHTKFISPESFQQYRPSDGAETVEVVTSSDDEILPDPDPEKQALREEISGLNQSVRELAARVAELEEAQRIKAQPEETGRIFSWVTGTYEPVRVINRGTRNGESFVTVLREGYDQPVTVFADEYEYWQSQAAKQESAPQNEEQARKRFSGRFQSARTKLSDIRDKTQTAWAQEGAPYVDKAKEAVHAASPYLKKAIEPIGIGRMYGQVLAENGPRLAGEAVRKAAEAAGDVSRKSTEAVGEASSQAIEAGKEPVGVGLSMVQVAGEQTVQIARDGISRGVIAGKMAGENIGSTAESIRSYRRRRICEVVGAGVMMWSVIFGPMKAETSPEDTAESGGGSEKIDRPPATV